MSVLLIAAIFSILGAFFIRRWFPLRYALTILGAKFSLPVLYWHVSGTVIPEYNDLAVDSFYPQTVRILDQGHTPLSLLIEGFVPIKSIMGTADPFYWWWNAVWISVIENSVHAPVLANVFVMTIAAAIAAATVGRLGYSYRYQQLFLLFVLFHWEVLTWSSLMNIKDPLVALLTVSSMYLVVTALQARKTSALLAAITALCGVLYLVTYIRWYVPGLLLGALCLWGGVELLRNWHRVKLTYVTATLSLVAVVGLSVLPKIAQFSMISLSYFPLGLYRYSIGPVPWGTADPYTFLAPAAALHWIFAPIAVIGVLVLLSNRYERLFLAYIVVAALLYAGLPTASGPRFRLQLVFFYALFQFHGLRFLIRRRYDIRFRVGQSAGTN